MREDRTAKEVADNTVEVRVEMVLQMIILENFLGSVLKLILVPLPSTLYPLPSTLYPLPSTLYPLPSTLYPLRFTL